MFTKDICHHQSPFEHAAQWLSTFLAGPYFCVMYSTHEKAASQFRIEIAMTTKHHLSTTIPAHLGATGRK